MTSMRPLSESVPTAAKVSALLALLAAPVLADTGAPVARAPVFALEGPTRDVHVGDVDGDGILDVVATVDDYLDLTIIRGLGRGELAAPDSQNVWGWSRGSAMGDLDGDGRADLIELDGNGFTGYRFGALLGQPDGTFLALPAQTLGSEPSDVELAHVDGDGVLDLIITLRGGDRVRVWRGDGDGTFSAGLNYDVGDKPVVVTSGDVDGDGWLDIAAGSESLELHVFLNAGDGTFGAPAVFSLAELPRDLEIGDVDDDGEADLLVARSDAFDVFHGTGGGALAPPVSYPTGPTDYGVDALDVVDVDLDGVPDLLMGTGGHVYLWHGSAGGLLSTPESYGAGFDAHRLVVADLDGDGITDLVVGNDSSQTVRVLPGRGDGLFVSREMPLAEDPRQCLLVDLDEDGRLDAVVRGSPGLFVLAGTDGLTFGPPVEQSALYSGHRGSAAAADLNGDGHSDVVVSTSSSSSADGTHVFLGAGDGTLTDVQTLDPGRRANGLAVADLNGDDVLDLAVTHNLPDEILTWHGNGDGTFVAGTTIPIPDDAIFSVAAGDMDGDGAVDLVLPDHDNMQILVHFGVGDGTFTSPPAALAGPWIPDELALADLDDDGALDIVATYSGSGDMLTVHLGKGDGTFGPYIETATLYGTTHVEPVDVTGDGVLDVVLTHQYRNAVSVLRGLGDGRLDPLGAYTTGASPTHVAADDLDGDGDRDLVLVNYNGDTLSVLANITSRFCDLGAGLPGTAGVPDLEGTGTLLPGDPATLTLADALPSATAYLVLGLSAVYAPFKQGTLVPSPNVVLPLPVDGTGSLVAPFPWPSGFPSAFTTYFQYWIPDPAGPSGFSASNALAGTTP